MPRVMIHMLNNLMQFWAEVINIACYTANRIFLRIETTKTSYELWIGRKCNLKYFKTFGNECYILSDEENLGKFDAEFDLGIFLGYSTSSKAYRVYNQNSQIIQESSNVIINDIRYDQDIIDNQILTYESIEDNLKDVETTKENRKDILERNISPNNDKFVPLNDTFEETRSKHRSIIPKNHLISYFIGNINEQVVAKGQSRLNEKGFVCYTSQLEPKNVKEALGDESWTTTLQEELKQFKWNYVWYLVLRSKDKHGIDIKWIFRNN